MLLLLKNSKRGWNYTQDKLGTDIKSPLSKVDMRVKDTCKSET